MAGSKIIDDLTPETSYRVSFYSGDEQSSDTYQARIEVKTTVTENLDEDYGTANRIDLRLSLIHISNAGKTGILTRKVY